MRQQCGGLALEISVSATPTSVRRDPGYAGLTTPVATLPSAYYLKDDLQYFPPGPEFKLTRQVQAMEEYKLRQQGGAIGDDVGPGPAATPPAPDPGL